MPTIDAAVRHDLTDAQWALLEPLLPVSARRGRPRRWPLRGLVDGIRHRVRVGCPWRDVPDRYGPWWRVYALFACWQVLGCGIERRPRYMPVPTRVGSCRGRCRWTPRPPGLTFMPLVPAETVWIALRENRITTR